MNKQNQAKAGKLRDEWYEGVPEKGRRLGLEYFERPNTCGHQGCENKPAGSPTNCPMGDHRGMEDPCFCCADCYDLCSLNV